MSGLLDQLIGGIAVIASVIAGLFYVRAKAANHRAEQAETRAARADAQAEALSKIELARNRARQVGEDELAKMKAQLAANDRSQLENGPQ